MSYAAQAGRQSVGRASRQQTSNQGACWSLVESPGIALAEQEFDLGKLPSGGEGKEREKKPQPPRPPPKLNTGQAKQVDESEPASGDVTTGSPTPFSLPLPHPPSSPEDPARARP